MNLNNVSKNVTREELERVARAMSEEALKKFAANLPPADAKYGAEDMGFFEMLLNQLGDDIEAVRRGEKRLTAEEVTRLLIDHTGRGIPAYLEVTSKVKDENASFTIELEQSFNYAEILATYLEAFHEFPELKFLSAVEFEDNAEGKRGKLLVDGLISNLVRRAHTPIPTPHLVVGDYGKALQKIFLKVLEEMYNKQFPNRSFNNYRDNDLEKKVNIIPDVGYDKFIAMMASGPNAIWYFPRALQGFSMNAAREAMKILIERSLALSGAISTSLAIIGNVEKMAGSFNTPSYDCSAVSWQSAGYSLYCGAGGGSFVFGNAGNLANANDNYSSGVLLLGLCLSKRVP